MALWKVGTKVRHARFDSEYIGRITRVTLITAQQASKNGAGNKPFILYAVKWEERPNQIGIPLCTHIDFKKGYRAQDLVEIRLSSTPRRASSSNQKGTG